MVEKNFEQYPGKNDLCPKGNLDNFPKNEIGSAPETSRREDIEAEEALESRE